MKLENVLTSLGLSKNMASLYLAALELGESTIQPLALHAGLPRATVYQLLGELQNIGLIFYSQKGKRRTIVAEDPYVLYEMQQQHLKSVEEALPELWARHNRSETKPRVFVYEGTEGIKKVYEDTLRRGESIRSFLQVGSVEPEIAEWLAESYMPRRAKKGIRIKNLVSGTLEDAERLLIKEGFYRDNRFINRVEYPASIEMMIYSNRVAFVTYKEGSAQQAIVIESAEVAATLKSLHKLGWNLGKA